MKAFFANTNPLKFFLMLKNKRELIYQFSKRDVISRYKGSFLGIIWSFITPLIMLAIYTFVFSVIFQAKWGTGIEVSKAQFALTLFCGLITYNVFSEMINKSATLIINNQNYVKKVVFPLEILPLSTLGSVLVHFIISLIALLLGELIFMGGIPWTVFFLPIVILPLLFTTLAFSYLISFLGVYIRDISYTVAIAINVLFYLTPIFYPMEAVPEYFRSIMSLNPLTSIVESMRAILLYNQIPNFLELFIWIVISMIFMLIAYAGFIRTKRGFSDVI